MKHCYTRILLSLVFLLGSLHVSALSLKAEETEVPEDYTLKEVVILSRHNIRAPLSTAGPSGGVPGMAHISEVEMYLQPRAVTPKA